MDLQDAPITLKPKLDFEALPKTTLSHSVNNVKKKAEIVRAEILDCELVLRTIQEFEDIATSTRFDLSTAPLKFEKFRECLGGTVRDRMGSCAQRRTSNR